jgi:hypothetical protein
VEVEAAKSPWFWFGLGMACVVCVSVIAVQCVIICKNMQKNKMQAIEQDSQNITQGEPVMTTT